MQHNRNMTPAPPIEANVIPIRAVSLPALIDRERKKRRNRRLVFAGVGVLVIAGVVAAVLLTRPRPTPMALRFRMEPVTIGPIVREVLATGHVEAVATVSIGAEISGRLSSVEVDFNDRVTAGQILARFDEGALKAQAAQSDAMAAASRAQLAQARADLAQARLNLTRANGLFSSGAQTQSEHETAVTAVALANARVGAAEATLAAQMAQASIAHTNLTHAVIRAPIDGVVITRNVDPGQTVASMLQTPVLFTVAADLRKMEVVAAVDEADIGEVHDGLPATFTVNAYPARKYTGVVTSVRNSAQVIQDVVTYGAVVAVENVDLTLKPGMTASARIETGRIASTPHVPNTALRFSVPNTTSTGDGVWILENGQPVRVPVHPGLSDGESTAIGATDLPADAKVLVDLTPEGKKTYAASEP